MTSERTRRRRGRLPKAERDRLADRLHLLADGDRDACRNRFSALALTPAAFAELWAQHGEAILAQWREVGHQPSAWWQWIAKRAGVTVPRISKVAA